MSRPSLDFNDILFVLFRHKRKVLALSLAGVVAAIVCLLRESGEEFQAKLLVRYVVERSSIDPVDPKVNTVNASTNGESVIKSEVEILTSADLAEQVAQAIGIERLLPHKGTGVSKVSDAAKRIAAGLNVSALRGSNVILISYRDRDPELARRVSEELVSRYFDKHLQVHRSLGAFDFVSQKTDEARKHLHQTEDELKQLKAKAGITSLAESTETVAAAMAKTAANLQAAKVELAEQRARLSEIERALSGGNGAAPQDGNPLAGTGAARQYEDLSAEVSLLRKDELNLLSKYTPESRAVQIRRAQIADLESRRRAMEKKIPVALPNGAAPASLLNLVAETANMAAIAARAETLEDQLREIEVRAARLSDDGTQIAQLERNKELEEANYKYLETSLEKARIDEALDPSKIPNISVVQKPSPVPGNATGRVKHAFLFAFGGIGSGVALAFFIELMLNPSVKRARELERRYGIPVLVSIPEAAQDKSLARIVDAVPEKSVQRRGLTTGSGPVQTLHPFFAAVRDRLALYFELNGISRKPKLVAVAGLSAGAGASTIAGGLAAALAETGEGKVLLVDMNTRDANNDPQFHGRPVCTLAEALRNGGALSGPAKNLHLTVVTGSDAKAGRIVPKKFYDLMPDLKASDFDYIIFDMPIFNQTSVTQAMAGLMDKFLLIVQAEKDHGDAVMQAHSELVAANASVTVILNKVGFHAPKWAWKEHFSASL